jgi:hypothetical protein
MLDRFTRPAPIAAIDRAARDLRSADIDAIAATVVKIVAAHRATWLSWHLRA